MIESSRRRLWTIALAGATFALLVLAAGRLRLDADISRMIPDADPRVGKASIVARALLERLTVDLAARDGETATTEQLLTAAEVVVSGLMSHGVRESTLLASASDVMQGLDALRESGPRVIDPSTLPGLESRLTQESLESRFKWLAKALQEPDSLSLGHRAAHDPIGISDAALVGLRDAAPSFNGARTVGNRIVSADGSRVLVLFDPVYPASDVDRTRVLMEQLESIRRGLALDPSTKSVKLRVLGAHRSTLDNVDGITRDAQRTATLGLVLATAFALLVYSSIWHVAVALIPALFGAALAAAVFALTRGSVAGAAVGFGSVLVGLTVDYANHAIFGLRSRGRIATGALLTSAATTVAAFLALTASSLPVVREIGIFGAIGVIGAAASTLALVPALVGRGVARRAPLIDLTKWVERVRGWRLTRLLPFVFVLVTPIIAYHVPKIQFDGDITKLNSLSPDARDDEAAILKAWEGGFRLTWIAAEGKTLAEALDVNDRVASHLASTKFNGDSLPYSSLTGLLPGLTEQARRLAGWHAFWTPERISNLRHSVEGAVRETPFRVDGFEPFFQWLGADPPKIDAEAVRQGPFAGLVRDRIIATSDGYLVTTSVIAKDWEQIRQVEQTLQAQVPEAILLNRESIARRLASIVGDEMWLLGTIALVAVAVATWMLMGSLTLVIVTVLPVVVSLVWTLGLLGWLGIPMSLVNAVFTAFLVGAAIDYSIVLVHGRIERWKAGVDETSFPSASVVLNAATAAAGFGVLAFASHPVLRGIGATAAVGISCAWAATQALTPILSDLAICQRGPGGVFRPRNAVSTTWVLWQLLSTKAAWSLFERWRTPATQRQAVAIRRIHEMGLRIRDGVPFCTTTHVNATADRFTSPSIIIANHESYYDSVAVSALPVPIAAFVKRYVWRAPLIGPLVQDAGYVLADGDDFDSMMAAARELIARGISPVVFPEGTRSKTGKLGRFRNGAFALARTLGVKVTPVALVNMRGSVRPGTWWVGDFDARVVVLDPMDPRDFGEEGGDKRMARAARENIRAAIREHWIATQGGTSWRPLLAGLYEPLGMRVRWNARRRVSSDQFIEALPSLIEGSDRVIVFDGGMGLATARIALAFPDRPIVGIVQNERNWERAKAALGGISAVSLQMDIDHIADDQQPTSVVIDQVASHASEAAQTAIASLIVRLVGSQGQVIVRTDVVRDVTSLSEGSVWRKLLLAHGLEGYPITVDMDSGRGVIVGHRFKKTSFAHG